MKSAQLQLLDLFTGLDETGQASLLAFAEFLSTRNPTGSSATPAAVTTPKEGVPAPENIERPADESIVGALKRLAKTYPMLDKSEMLGATSDMVATHVMQGTDPTLVIDQLEAIFADHYRKLQKESGG